MDSEQLAACPFCGLPPVREDAEEATHIYCDSDDCIGPSTTSHSALHALAAWNRRAAPAASTVQPAEFDRDNDGDLLIDWSPAKGRMVTLALAADGVLSYAFTWDGESAHGTAQMPRSLVAQDKGHLAVSEAQPVKAQPAYGASDVTQAAKDVLAERNRQIEEEGYGAWQDDEYRGGVLASAGASYACTAALALVEGRGTIQDRFPPMWPWQPDCWKPCAPRRALVKACALILAEIERGDRASSPMGADPTTGSDAQ
jgi:hypothetical protein